MTFKITTVLPLCAPINSGSSSKRVAAQILSVVCLKGKLPGYSLNDSGALYSACRLAQSTRMSYGFTRSGGL